jgi:hypothetical protein
MKLYDDIIKTKFTNHMIRPKHIMENKPIIQNKITLSVKPKIQNKPLLQSQEATDIINKNLNSEPLTIEQITDKIGLDRAYARESKLYVHANTLYIAGTSSVQDMYDDLKIPFNQTSKSMRYENAMAISKTNPDIQNISGHSLGGSVALELQKKIKDKNYNVNTYGAPVFSLGDYSTNRYRNQYDPVSILDQSAETVFTPTLDPHSYSNFDKNKVDNNSFSSYTYRTDS